MKKVICIAMAAGMLCGCSALNSFVKAQDNFFHKTLGISTGDKNLDEFWKSYGDMLDEMPYQRLNTIVDGRLQHAARSDDTVISIMGIRHTYIYQDNDCNIAFQFDDENKMMRLKQIKPELLVEVTVNGKRKANIVEGGLARAAAETKLALPVGRCTVLRKYLDLYTANGGAILTDTEINAYLDKIRKEVAEANSIVVADALETVNADIKAELENPSEENKEAINDIQKVNSLVSGQLAEIRRTSRPCIQDSGETGEITAASGDDKVMFKKDSTGEIVEVEISSIGICKISE